MSAANIVIAIQIATFVAGGALLLATNWKLAAAQWLLSVVTGLVYFS